MGEMVASARDGAPFAMTSIACDNFLVRLDSTDHLPTTYLLAFVETSWTCMD